MGLDGFSMAPLARELNDKLAGGRIDKITQPAKNLIILSVHQPGDHFLLHISINSQNPSAHLLSHNMENPPEPPVFCMVLRKHIDTGRIAGIRQHGLDRMLLIDIDTIAGGGRIATKTLVLELMGKYSNIILTQDNVIVDALRKIGTNSSRFRTVLPGQEYILPPGQDKLNLFTTPIDTFISAIKQHEPGKLSKVLLDVCLGFGPVSAKESAYLAGLPANIITDQLEACDFASLGDALAELRDACQQDSNNPVILLDENKKILAMAAFPLHYLTAPTVLSFDSLSSMLEAADKLAGSYVLPDRDRFRKLISNELKKAITKGEKLELELQESENADEYRVKADNLMTYQYQYKDHEDDAITVTNIYSEAGQQLIISLDKKFTLVRNMQNYYRKYEKLRRAHDMVIQQIADCQNNIDYLKSIQASLESSATLAEIAEIHDELIAAKLLNEKPKKRNNEKPSRPFRFTAPDGTIILVGKNNYQNDKLTFKTASFNDIWLHTKDIPGSHVILRCGGMEPSEETLLLAASLAGHFSQASGSSKIPVDYTQCRYVKKPSGSKPGFVIFTNQKTLYITPDDSKLAPIINQQQ